MRDMDKGNERYAQQHQDNTLFAAEKKQFKERVLDKEKEAKIKAT